MSTLTKVSEKDLPQLYCMKMKICYDVCFIDISGVTLMRPLRILLTLYFSVTGLFLRNHLRELVPSFTV